MLLEVFGWLGSILVVVSLMLSKAWRFRVVNLAGSIIATAYNAVLSIWPFVAMNLAIAVINVYWLWRLRRPTAPERSYSVLETSLDSDLARHFLQRHSSEIAAAYPHFDALAPVAARTTLVTMHEDEIVGLLVLRREAEGVGTVELDFVTEAYRDLSPARQVYSANGVLAGLGVRTVRVGRADATDARHFTELGFHAQDTTLELQLARA